MRACGSIWSRGDILSEQSFSLHQIYFYLTEGCNLACRHCWLAPKYDPEGTNYPTLPIALFEKIIADAKPLGLKAVKLTGGEPLLNPDFLAMLDVVRQEGLRLTIETNGLLCTAHCAQAIKEACEKSFVSVSLDGADAQTHESIRGVKGSFEAAIEGIKNLVDAGFKPQVIFTVMKRNREQVESVISLAEDLGAGSVKYNVVQPTARGEHLHDQDETLDIRELVSLGRHIETTVSTSTDIRLHFSHPAAFVPLGRMAYGGSCGVCGIKGIIGVLANGKYALCGIGETVPDLIFGDAATDSLAEIWEGNPILCKIRQDLPAELSGICRRCLMKHRCLGSCVAQNYYRSKDLMAPFWFCEEAEAEGLFPPSRIAAVS
jgi:SynChlorMet cassette radical SAM/SPASM protein ScmF